MADFLNNLLGKEQTTDTILSAFNETINKLESHSETQKAKAANVEEQILSLQKESKRASQ